MRLLVADRDGDYNEVQRIIDFSQSDPFWRSNILSPAKLRKQFTQLVLRASNVVSFASSQLPESQRASAEWQAQAEAYLAAMRPVWHWEIQVEREAGGGDAA